MRARKLRGALAGKVLAMSGARAGDAAFSTRHSAMAVMVAGALAVMAAPAAVQAQQEARVNFSIPAQPLASALRAFASQGKQQLLFDEDKLARFRAPALEGSYSPREALNRLLAGTGITVIESQPGAFTLRTAPDQPSTDADAAALPAVVVTGKADNPTTTEGLGGYAAAATTASSGLLLAPREVPQAVSIVTRQQLDDQSLTELTEVAAQVPGVYVSRGGLSGSDSTSIYSRGFSVNNYLQNGQKMIADYGSLFQSQDMALYDRVEVVRGAAGLMVGAGAPGASINLVRKLPTSEFQGKASISAGSWSYRRLDVDVSGPLNDRGSLRGRLVAAVQDADSWIDRAGDERKILYGVLEGDVGRATVVRAGVSHQRIQSNAVSRGGLPAFFSDGSRAIWSRSASAGAAWAYSKRNSTSIFAEAEHQLNPDWRLKASLTRVITDADELPGSLQRTPDRFTGAGTGVWTTHWLFKPVQDMLDLSTTGRFSLLGRSHDFAAGLQLARSEQKRDNVHSAWVHDGWDRSIANIFTWDGNTPARPLNPAIGYGGEKVTSNGLYASVRLRPTDTLSVIIGSRFADWRRTSYQHLYATGQTTTTERQETGEVLPYLGITQNLGQHWTLYGGFTTIFQAQNQRTLSGDYLDPLQGDSTEIGLKGAFFDDRLNLAASVYRIRQDNLAVAIPDTLTPDGSQAYEPKSGTQSRGFELEVAGQLRPGWQISASYSHNRVRDRLGEPLLTSVPRSTFRVFTTARLQSVGNGLTVGGGVSWQSGIYSLNMGPNQVRFEQPSYAVVELMARYPINNRLAVRFNLSNALDKVYYQTTGSSYYGAPRAVRLGLEMSL